MTPGRITAAQRALEVLDGDADAETLADALRVLGDLAEDVTRRRNQLALDLLRQGWGQKMVAEVLGVSRGRVAQLLMEHRKAHPGNGRKWEEDSMKASKGAATRRARKLRGPVPALTIDDAAERGAYRMGAPKPADWRY